MKKILLNSRLNKYKSNLHCHSTVSDGGLTPAEIKKLYMENGYSVIAYTDHDVFIAHDELTDDNFLALHGYEMEFCGDNKTCHICLIQRDPDNMQQIFWHRSKYLFGNAPQNVHKVCFDESQPDFERTFSPECISKVMRKGRECGFFITYNHPTWSLENFNDYMNYDGMHAMEIFNYGCYVEGHEEYNARVYDDMLRGGKKIYCISTDDNHNASSFESSNNDSCGGFTVIFADELSYTKIMDALFDGNFYSSQGPEIYELTYEDKSVHIKCSPAQKIIFTTNLHGGSVSTENKTGAELVNEAIFTVSEDDTYLRITVIDENGKIANTNAYQTEDLFK